MTREFIFNRGYRRWRIRCRASYRICSKEHLQYQQIVNINWNKLQATSQHAVTTLVNATTQFSNHIGNITDSNNHTTVTLSISQLGLTLTGSMAMGFGIGFMKG